MLSLLKTTVTFQAVLLCLTSLVASQQYAGEQIPNSLPVVNGANLTYFAIANPSGSNKVTLTNYVSLNSKGGRAVGAGYKRAVIVIHGLNRDPQTYMANMLSALNTVPNTDVNADSVAIMAPYFPNGNDKTTNYPWTAGLAAGAGSTSSALVWTGSTFADGANNIYPYKSKTVSSFEAVDQMVKYYSTASIFPNMKQIVIAGHSLGAQYVQRYAMMGNTLSVAPTLTYWIGNPNSFGWFTTDRPLDYSTCPTYDVWRDGLTNYTVGSSYNTALYNKGRDAVYSNYQSRAIGYGRATQDSGDDSSNCDPFSTGQNRNERFFNFIQRFPPSCSGTGGCDTIDYANCGHDAGCMFADPSGQARLFLDNFNGTGNRAYDFGYPRVQAGDDPYPNPNITQTSNATNSGLSGTFSGMTYIGCFTDTTPATLSYSAYSSQSNTVELCASTCAGSGYSIAGVENGEQCRCGNSISASAIQTVEQGCTAACTGNSSEICGNYQRLSVYSNGTPKILATPVTPATIGSFAYRGCYQDNNPARALSAKATTSSSMTLDQCASFCSGYNYFGTEYATECYCGNSLSTGNGLVTSSDCNMVCSGNSTQLCGAGNRLTLYYSNSTAVATTTSTAAGSAATGSAIVCPSANGQIYTATSGKTYQIECGVDHAGGDLTSSYTTTLAGCIQACDSTTGCVAYSWVATSNGNNAPCYMKSSIGAANTNSGVMGGKYVSNSTASATGSSTATNTTTSATTTSIGSIPTSTALVCPGSNGALYVAASGKTYQVQCSTDHYGGDLSVSYASTLQGCIDSCDATTSCVAWSWVASANGNNAPCYMKSSIGANQVNGGVMGGMFYAAANTTASSSAAAATGTTTSASTTTSTTAAISTVLACPSSNGVVYTAASGKSYQVECYNDHAGGDLSMIYASTLVGCVNACDSTKGCVAYSWVSGANGNNAPCYLKSSIGANQVSNGVWGGKFVVVAGNSTATTSASASSVTSATSISTSVSTSVSTTAAAAASATLASGVNYLGCYADGSTRTLPHQAYSNSNNSPATCQAACSAAGYPYSGTEYTSECWCGSTAPVTTSTACTMTCSGDSSQICGGPNALSIVQDTTVTAVTFSARTSYSTWVLMNCYVDSTASRTLADGLTPLNGGASNATAANCLDACSAKGYSYCGTEYYSECYGSLSAPLSSAIASGSDGTSAGVIAAGCSLPCTGNSTESCGGANRIQVYMDTSKIASNSTSMRIRRSSRAVRLS